MTTPTDPFPQSASADGVSFVDLPVTPGAPPHSSWGLWGAEDRCGALNRLTPQRARAARELVRDGVVVPLDLPADAIDPPLFGRAAAIRRVVPLGGAGTAYDEVLDGWNAQAASQWDGFAHVVEPGVGSYNGLPRERHGVAHWARHGIVGRGVLVDLARWWAGLGRDRDPSRRGEIEPADLDRALAAQGGDGAGSVLREGDLLLVRTGWLSFYRSLSPDGRAELARGTGESLGLRAGRETARWLWDNGVAAVAADNPSLEAWPPRPPAGPFSHPPAGAPAQPPAIPPDEAPDDPGSLHRWLLARLGIPIGELWDLDRLAELCADRCRYEFLCVSVPLALPGGVASPANAVAVL